MIKKILSSALSYVLILFFFVLISFLFSSRHAQALPLKKFLKKPKLVVVVVIDQFRADYLPRLHSRFIKAGSAGQVGGFDFLMSQGAYYPFAEYNVLQSMTCPGHSMILTGSTPSNTGIPPNEYFDRKSMKMRYCVEDEEFGLSPRALKTSTVGDELKNISPKSKVIAISQKDRSAILLGGHQADNVLWLDSKAMAWSTSAFYAKNSVVPAWAQAENRALKAEAGKDYLWKTPAFEKHAARGSRDSMITAYGTEIIFRLAESALKAEKLGQNGVPDILALSVSNHDYVGHLFGPNSKEIEELVIAEDQQLSKLFTSIKKQLGSMDDVVIALTADHGIAPTTEESTSRRVPAGKIDYLKIFKLVNQKLDEKFGTPKNKSWMIATKLFHFYFDPEVLSAQKVSNEMAENEAREIIKAQPGVSQVITRSESLKGIWPVGPSGEQAKNQFLPELNGDLILVPEPFYFDQGENTTTHITGYSYDRQVPLVIYSSKLKPGVRAEKALVIDLAPTLSFILGSLAPAQSQGRVLQEIF